MLMSVQHTANSKIYITISADAIKGAIMTLWCCEPKHLQACPFRRIMLTWVQQICAHKCKSYYLLSDNKEIDSRQKIITGGVGGVYNSRI